MALIDERGRLFGRINIIDAAVLLLLVAMIPLAYGAVILFRQPEPVLRAVEPSVLSPRVERIRITGENLRPFLRVSFNDHQGTTFALIDAQTAEVRVPELPAGSYDVILYDVAREVSRLRGAVTVEGPAAPLSSESQLLVAGRFVGLDEAVAAKLQQGAPLVAPGGRAAEIVARGTPEPDRRWLQVAGRLIEAPMAAGVQLPVVLRTPCLVANLRCQLGGVDVDAGNVLAISIGDAITPLRFEVSEAVSDGPTVLVDVTVGLVTPPGAVSLIRPGDRAGQNLLLGDRIPVVTRVGAVRRADATINLPPPAGVPSPGDWSAGITDSMAIVETTLRVRASSTSDGPQYRGRRIAVGAPFVFDNPQYVLRGIVHRVEQVPESNGGSR
jgi:hypothetical protein